MGYYDRKLCAMLGEDQLPEGDWVLPVLYGENAGMYAYRAGSSSGYCKDEDQAHRTVASIQEGTRQFWREKVLWKQNGDRAPMGLAGSVLSAQQDGAVYGHGQRPGRIIRQGPRNVIRCDGWHYVAMQFGIVRNGTARGFGGRVFHWVFLDDPEQTVHVSNDIFSQGEIPAEFAEELPDNARWISPKDEAAHD